MPTALTSPAGPPYIAGYPIGRPTSYPELEEQRERQVTHRQADDGTTREYSRCQDAALPVHRVKREFRLDWKNLSTEATQQLEEVLCQPGPYTLALWKHVWSGYVGDAAATTWQLPWPQATSYVSPPGVALPFSRLAPIVKVNGVAYTTETLDQGTYDAGEPAAGEAWFVDGGLDWKVLTAPAADVPISVAIVPLFTVWDASATAARSHKGDLLRPVRLVLREV